MSNCALKTSKKEEVSGALWSRIKIMNKAATMERSELTKH